ncbi:MAG TPA: AraC family transcriptional regulator [Casimicrobiaceae bacterium]|nr:AraC family transcriptional regulator [Casimicrobiaceae bacterium]
MRDCDVAADVSARGTPTVLQPSRPRPRAATSVLSGTIPDPLLSSRGRGWNGLTVELQSFSDLDVVVQASDHVVAVHLAGSVNVHRSRCGRTRSRTMCVGDVIITPAGPPTRWRQAGQSLVVLLRLSPAYVRSVAGDECALDPDRFDIQGHFATRDERIDDIARRLLAGLELEGSDSHLYVDALTCELAIHLLREYTVASATPAWPMARLSPHKLRRAIEYIDDNLRSELTLAAMAEAVALSPGHFAHAFRQATGVAPHRYVVERRVERAKALLRESDMPITEIADRVGCSSHSHFSVLFHRVTGLTPRQFRAQE